MNRATIIATTLMLVCTGSSCKKRRSYVASYAAGDLQDIGAHQSVVYPGPYAQKDGPAASSPDETKVDADSIPAESTTNLTPDPDVRPPTSHQNVGYGQPEPQDSDASLTTTPEQPASAPVLMVEAIVESVADTVITAVASKVEETAAALQSSTESPDAANQGSSQEEPEQKVEPVRLAAKTRTQTPMEELHGKDERLIPSQAPAKPKAAAKAKPKPRAQVKARAKTKAKTRAKTRAKTKAKRIAVKKPRHTKAKPRSAKERAYREGLAAQRNGQTSKANELFLLSCSAGYYEACNHFGFVRLKEGNAGGARSYFKIACHNGVARGCNNLGWAFERQSNFEKAKLYYSQACAKRHRQGCANYHRLRAQLSGSAQPKP